MRRFSLTNITSKLKKLELRTTNIIPSSISPRNPSRLSKMKASDLIFSHNQFDDEINSSCFSFSDDVVATICESADFRIDKNAKDLMEKRNAAVYNGTLQKMEPEELIDHIAGDLEIDYGANRDAMAFRIREEIIKRDGRYGLNVGTPETNIEVDSSSESTQQISLKDEISVANKNSNCNQKNVRFEDEHKGHDHGTYDPEDVLDKILHLADESEKDCHHDKKIDISLYENQNYVPNYNFRWPQNWSTRSKIRMSFLLVIVIAFFAAAIFVIVQLILYIQTDNKNRKMFQENQNRIELLQEHQTDHREDEPEQVKKFFKTLKMMTSLGHEKNQLKESPLYTGTSHVAHDEHGKTTGFYDGGDKYWILVGIGIPFSCTAVCFITGVYSYCIRSIKNQLEKEELRKRYSHIFDEKTGLKVNMMNILQGTMLNYPVAFNPSLGQGNSNTGPSPIPSIKVTAPSVIYNNNELAKDKQKPKKIVSPYENQQISIFKTQPDSSKIELPAKKRIAVLSTVKELEEPLDSILTTDSCSSSSDLIFDEDIGQIISETEQRLDIPLCTKIDHKKHSALLSELQEIKKATEKQKDQIRQCKRQSKTMVWWLL